jgi:hypothetical protein
MSCSSIAGIEFVLRARTTYQIVPNSPFLRARRRRGLRVTGQTDLANSGFASGNEFLVHVIRTAGHDEVVAMETVYDVGPPINRNPAPGNGQNGVMVFK